MKQYECKDCKTKMIKFIGIYIDKKKIRYRQYQCMNCGKITRINQDKN